MPITCGILTVSDTCFTQQNKDLSGPALEQFLKSSFPDFQILERAIVPDDFTTIASILNSWIEKSVNLVITTGGTGFGPRDVTPEATRSVIEREAPGLVYGMVARGLNVTQMAMLSRGVAGIKDRSLVVNLPGSVKGATEGLGFLKEVLPHALALVVGNQQEVGEVHRELQKVGLADEGGPSKVLTDNVAERPRESTFPMVEITEAHDLILKETARSPDSERIAIEESLYRVLAEDVLSHDNIPPFDASIKDGYAVKAEDADQPRRVRNAIKAGDSPDTIPLQRGEAIRIGTGAPIPPGADAVVQVENTKVLKKEGGEEIEISVDVIPVKGQDIRRLGCDVSKNTIVLVQGERLKAAHIGILASVGKSTITVYKRPSVGIFTTGNELREHFEELLPGQIRDSNRLALINLLKEYHYECDDYGIVRDEPDAIKRAIASVLTINDILITTGGVSMGEFDFIKRVLVEDFNAKVHFGRVNIKPGKPTTFATLDFAGTKKIVFGLPGNPVSACVSCVLFVLPLLRHLEGAIQWQFPMLPYVVSVCKINADPRPEYLRVVVSCVDGKIVAKRNGGQLSSRLNSFLGANGLLLMPGSMFPTKEYLSHIILLGDILPM